MENEDKTLNAKLDTDLPTKGLGLTVQEEAGVISRNVSNELEGLADSVGDFIQYFGFKKIHGRIWAHLFLSRKPLAAIELSRRLGVSKTLLSFSVVELLEHQVIQEAGRGPRRMIYYRVNPDLEQVIFNVLRNREKMMLERIAKNFLPVQKLTSDQLELASMDAQRVEEMGHLIQNASLALEALLNLTPVHTKFSQHCATVAKALAH